MDINLERIKKYNENLKMYNEKAAQLRIELNYAINELNKLCKELSDTLRIEVTPSNIEEIYKQYVQKVEETLKIGEEIIARIQAEEQQLLGNGSGNGTNSAEVTVRYEQTEKGRIIDIDVMEKLGFEETDTDAGPGSLPNMFGGNNIKI